MVSITENIGVSGTENIGVPDTENIGVPDTVFVFRSILNDYLL